MCETEAGSMSLSYFGAGWSALGRFVSFRRGGRLMITYWDLLLGQYDGAILAAHSYRHDVGICDGLEGIFCVAQLSASGRDTTSYARQRPGSRVLCWIWAFASCAVVEGMRTDLVQSSLVREDCDVSVVCRSSCPNVSVPVQFVEVFPEIREAQGGELNSSLDEVDVPDILPDRKA